MEQNVINKNIDYNVLNALYLTSEELGKEYEKTGYNPYSENFKLQNDFVKEKLNNKKSAIYNFDEEFLTVDNSTFKKHSSYALANVILLQKNIEDTFLTKDEPRTVYALKDFQIYLNNLKTLLTKVIDNSTENDFDSIKNYALLFNLDTNVGDIISKLFYEEADIANIFSCFLSSFYDRQKVEIVKQKIEAKKIKNIAIQKNIISTSHKTIANNKQKEKGE